MIQQTCNTEECGDHWAHADLGSKFKNMKGLAGGHGDEIKHPSHMILDSQYLSLNVRKPSDTFFEPQVFD